MLKFCNINITDKSKDDLFRESGDLQIIIPMNAECIVKSNENEELLSFINSNRTTIDGQIPLWLFKWKYHNEKIIKLSGSDIIYDFCSFACSEGLKVFFLGGKENSNFNAVIKMRNKYSSLSIDGFSPPYETYPFSPNNNNQIKEKIISFNPDIIFVGFGFVKQERWIKDNIDFLNLNHVRWVICSGGTFEFISGELKRAPKTIQKIGLEGAWRLIMEPKLFRIKRLLTSFKIFKYVNTK